MGTVVAPMRGSGFTLALTPRVGSVCADLASGLRNSRGDGSSEEFQGARRLRNSRGHGASGIQGGTVTQPLSHPRGTGSQRNQPLTHFENQPPKGWIFKIGVRASTSHRCGVSSLPFDAILRATGIQGGTRIQGNPREHGASGIQG
eukprot:4465690-Pyramimonas_sp.AAC.1